MSQQPVSSSSSPVSFPKGRARRFVSGGEAARCIDVVGCVDDRYAKGLGVTLVSAAEHLRVGWVLRAHIVDGGLSGEERERLVRTCQASGIDVVFHEFDLARLRRLPVSHHISHAAYIRMLLGEVLPESVTRAVYLDSDLIIRDDLVELWQTDLEGSWCGAVPDIACPYIDATVALENLRECGPYLAAFRPVANWRRLGLDPSALYFNSGLLLLDLESWRREELARRALEVLRDHRRYVWCWDQYALNVVLAGHWKPLPLRWNCGAHLWEYPTRQALPLSEQECVEALESPAVVHFTTRDKPWHADSEHPLREEFYLHLDRTAWAEWRPEPLGFSLPRWWMKRSAVVQKELTIRWRKWRLGSG